MATLSSILNVFMESIKLSGKVADLSAELGEVKKEVRAIEKRLLRMEVMLEWAEKQRFFSSRRLEFTKE